MRFGVHCSIAGGLENSVQEAIDKKCQTIQIFLHSPITWKINKFTSSEINNFKSKLKQNNIYPLIVHLGYLPNLCSANPWLYKRSQKSLIKELEITGKLGADFLILHPGSYKGMERKESIKRFARAINNALKKVKNKVMILIENTSGGGWSLGARFMDIRNILALIKDKKRVGVCFDTCHAFTNGYDISRKQTLYKTLTEFNILIGIDKIKVIHINDCKAPLGSHLDRHEHLGKGFIGKKGFKPIINFPGFKNCSLILETPKDKKHYDAMNLKFLSKLLI